MPTQVADPALAAQLSSGWAQQQLGGSDPFGDPTGGLQGDALLKHFEKNDPATAAMIKGIIAGDISAKGRNLQSYMPYAALVDPTLHQSDYDTRLATRKSYTGQGKNALELKAVDTAIGHADQLDKLNERLGNFGILPSVINPAYNAVRSQFSKEFQGIQGERESKVEALAGELSKAFNGGQTAVSDREHWRGILSQGKSPAEMQAAIRSAMDLLESRLRSHESTYKEGMGRAAEGMEFLKPNRREIFDRLRGQAMEKAAAEAGAAPAAAPGGVPGAPGAVPVNGTQPGGLGDGAVIRNPKTGQRLMLRNNEWVSVP